MTCNARVAHPDAQAIIDALMVTRGVTNETNLALGARLGLTKSRFRAARTHSHECLDLPWTIAYRRRGTSLTLIDPAGVGTLEAVKARTRYILNGWATRLAEQETEQSRMVVAAERAASDAFDKGARDLGRLLDRAATELSATGNISTRTRQAIEAELIVP